jgi:hypothetical protein
MYLSSHHCEIHNQHFEEYYGCLKCLFDEQLNQRNSDIKSVLMGIIDLTVHRPLFTQEVRKEWYFQEFDKLIKEGIKLTGYETPDSEGVY